MGHRHGHRHGHHSGKYATDNKHSKRVAQLAKGRQSLHQTQHRSRDMDDEEEDERELDRDNSDDGEDNESKDESAENEEGENSEEAEDGDQCEEDDEEGDNAEQEFQSQMNAVTAGHSSDMREEEWEWRSGDQYDTFDETPYQSGTDTNWYASPLDDSFTNTTRWHDMIHENNPYAFKKKKAKKYM